MGLYQKTRNDDYSQIPFIEQLSFAEGKDESIAQLFDMFSSFKKFFGSAVFAVAFCVRHILVFAAALLPGGAFFWFAKTYIPDGNRTLELLKISAGCIAVAIMISLSISGNLEKGVEKSERKQEFAERFAGDFIEFLKTRKEIESGKDGSGKSD